MDFDEVKVIFMSKINKLVDDFSHKILKNVASIRHNTTLLLSAFPRSTQSNWSIQAYGVTLCFHCHIFSSPPSQ